MAILLLTSPLIQPEWITGETLFSLCARIHRLSCNALSSDTTRILFGSTRAGSQHDFPNRLAELVARSQGHWGSVDDLIERTLLPYYLPLSTPELALEARAILSGVTEGILKFRLGLLTGRFRAHHPLKACPKCQIDDKKEHFVGYWHRDHQLPGATICLVHHEPLLEFQCKANGVRRFDWCLPDEGGYTRILSASADHEALGNLLRLAGDARALASLPAGFHFAPEQLYRCYRHRAIEIGYRRHDRPAWQALAADYLVHCSRLRAAEPLAALPANQAESRRELERLLRRLRSHTHPIRHLALIGFLFPDWGQFIEAYLATAPETDSEPPPPGEDLSRDARFDDLVSLLNAGDHSCSQAASIVGISVGTAMAWAAQAGISIPRRAKSLKPKVRIELEAALRAGIDKGTAAKRFGISSSTVTTILRTTPNLHESWIRIRLQHLRDARRTEWAALQATHPEAGVKVLRELAPACYAWLYRNDRAWLTDPVRQPVVAPPKGNNSRLNWDARDQTLAAEVQRTALVLAMQFPDRPIPLWALCQALPELKAKIGHLDKLPLTQRALSVARRRRDSTPPLL